MDSVLVVVVSFMIKPAIRVRTRLQPKSSGPKAEEALEVPHMPSVREMGPRLATEQKIPAPPGVEGNFRSSWVEREGKKNR